jgi:hypothetical protein
MAFMMLRTRHTRTNLPHDMMSNIAIAIEMYVEPLADVPATGYKGLLHCSPVLYQDA